MLCTLLLMSVTAAVMVAHIKLSSLLQVLSIRDRRRLGHVLPVGRAVLSEPSTNSSSRAERASLGSTKQRNAGLRTILYVPALELMIM